MSEDQYEPSFWKRLGKLELSSFIKSYDTFAGLLSIPIVYSLFNGGLPKYIASDILMTFSTVAGALFAIILTGLTIITSFTDERFLYLWHKIGEFENLVTYFQYNLMLPIIILLFSTVLQIYYNEYAMLLLIAIFVYFLFSLYHLMALISRYALQRGEFIRQQMEGAQVKQKGENRLSNDELERTRQALEELNEE